MFTWKVHSMLPLFLKLRGFLEIHTFDFPYAAALQFAFLLWIIRMIQGTVCVFVFDNLQYRTGRVM